MTSASPAPDILNERRYSPKEAAAPLGYRSTRSVLRKIEAGELAPVLRKAKRGIGAIEIPESTIKAFLARHMGGRVAA